MLRNIVYHPLGRVPGPLLAAITDQYLVLHDLAGFRTRTIHQLHQKYGSIVRIAPNEVSFSDKSTIKDLYGQSTQVIKAPIYDTFPKGVFGMRKKEDHRQRRRYLSHAFSLSYLVKVEPVIQEKVQTLKEIIDKSTGQSMNILQWFRMLALDIISIDYHKGV